MTGYHVYVGGYRTEVAAMSYEVSHDNGPGCRSSHGRPYLRPLDTGSGPDGGRMACASQRHNVLRGPF